MKVHVYMRNLGIASRRKAETLIEEGRVKINGKIAKIGQHVEGTESVSVDNTIVAALGVSSKTRVVIVNKPRGYTSTTATNFKDEQSVLLLLPTELQSVNWQIVGRLDKESEGLLVLTNDGNLGYTLTHPKFNVKKKYQVSISRKLTDKELQLLESGVMGKSGDWYSFVSVVRISDLIIECVLSEGKKREIREALAVMGVTVTRLVRVQFGSLSLGTLQTGKLRELSEEELNMLLRYVQEAEANLTADR